MKVCEASRATSINFSAIRAAAQAAEDLTSRGIRIIDLTLGRPDFDTPTHIKEAAKMALDDGKVHYTSNYGIIELRQALSEKLRKENGLDYTPDEIIVTVGTSEALTVALMAFVEPGDEVLVPEPCFVNYVSQVRLCGGIPVYVSMEKDGNFSLFLSRILEKLTSRTKAILYASPNNPTGTVLNRETLSQLAKVAADHNLLVISDEVYEKIIYDDLKHHSIGALPKMRERTITCNAFSKTYSMTGWRIGYLAADKALIIPMIKVHQSFVACANSFSQWGALAGIEGSQNCVEEMFAEFTRRRAFLIDAFKTMSPLRLVVPDGSFFAFIDIRKMGMTSAAATDFFIKHAHVAMVPGSGFGPSGEGYIRLSFTCALHLLEEAVVKMRTALK